MAKRGLDVNESKNIATPIITTPSVKFKEQNFQIGYANLSPMLSK
mgnify:CR=1 FL=1